MGYAQVSQGDPQGAMEALQLADSLFSATSSEWAQVLPTKSLVEVAVIDGRQGPEAAGDFLRERADQLADMGRAQGSSRLESQASLLRQEAEQMYGMEAQMRQALDSLADGTVYTVWLGVESDMAFGNVISARRRVRSYADTTSSPETADLMETRLEEIVRDVSASGRTDLYSTGWFLILGGGSDSLTPLLETSTDFFSKGRTMAAAAGTWMMADRLPAPQRDLARGYAQMMVGLGREGSTQLAQWFSMWAHHVPGPELSGMCAELGSPALAWLALDMAGGHEDLKAQILQDAAGGGDDGGV
jgi:hypothetical protein